MRISDGSSDVCSSDLRRWHDSPLGLQALPMGPTTSPPPPTRPATRHPSPRDRASAPRCSASASVRASGSRASPRSEEHTSELQSLMRISYAVFCLKKKKSQQKHNKYMTNDSICQITPRHH